eukprot:CAMPEP_0198124314 /NCGR_PEP_ID=MMETSP1442-20131203/39663_1 /TAXON_ID= /ORGANISM="Craspedostauros australis, Strain CCMP3328" /LENGTH=71 /DNA_ID=CAMNT_0043783695 /DNA_START=56 /DNA_END=271 /DNA_ORIENTATION=+
MTAAVQHPSVIREIWSPASIALVASASSMGDCGLLRVTKPALHRASQSLGSTHFRWGELKSPADASDLRWR